MCDLISAARRLTFVYVVALPFGIAALPVAAQEDDVTFFVIGKHANFDQQQNGERQAVDYSFFSEIFLTDNGNADNAFLNMPTGERIRFRDQRAAPAPDTDNLLLVSGAKRFASYEQLLSWYPDGAYQVEFNTPSGHVDSGDLNFPAKGLPNSPKVKLRQRDAAVCATVNPNSDLEVRWTPFTQGKSDPNGILDDLIFAILEDESGERIAHSGRPFSGKPFLTFADDSYTIPASVLNDNHDYTISVEHALLTDTREFNGVPAMTTYAVTTNLKFRTSVHNAKPCAAGKATADLPTTDAQVVMFYYLDLAAADRFYGETLGFEKTLDESWVKIYRTSDTSSVGLVRQGEGAWHNVQEQSAVMLSIVTSEVDTWYERLQKGDGVEFLKPIGDGGPIRSFLVEDPGGYTVEFFQWLNDAAE